MSNYFKSFKSKTSFVPRLSTLTVLSLELLSNIPRTLLSVSVVVDLSKI